MRMGSGFFVRVLIPLPLSMRFPESGDGRFRGNRPVPVRPVTILFHGNGLSKGKPRNRRIYPAKDEFGVRRAAKAQRRLLRETRSPDVQMKEPARVFPDRHRKHPAGHRYSSLGYPGTLRSRQYSRRPLPVRIVKSPPFARQYRSSACEAAWTACENSAFRSRR